MKRELFTKDFTLLVLGQAFSLAGGYVLRFALSMYVLELTGSAGVFAGMLAAAMLPTILLSPLGGVMADRCDRRRLMVLSDALAGAAALLALPALEAFGGTGTAAGLLILLSVLGAFESPVVQAALPQLHSGENILRGNAVINQVAALAGLAAPFLGSLLYAALGLGPVLLGAGLCFLLTALLERFIRLAKLPGRAREGGLLGTLYGDLAESLHFLRREERDVLRLLLLAALVSFFAAGAALVGFPYLVREVLGLTAELYGAAESALGAAALLGALAAGVFGPRLRRRQLLISAFGLSLLPAGAAFLLPLGAIARYLVLTAAFFAGQLCCSLYSVLAVSMIQQRTPEQLTGKVMALTSTIAMCAQPLGQLAYGALFDLVGNEAELILLPTGLALLLLGLRPCFTNPGRVLK